MSNGKSAVNAFVSAAMVGAVSAVFIGIFAASAVSAPGVALAVSIIAIAVGKSLKDELIGSAAKYLVTGGIVGASLVAGSFSSAMKDEMVQHQDFTDSHISIAITPEMKKLDQATLEHAGEKFLGAFVKSANAKSTAQRRTAYEACSANEAAFNVAGVDCKKLTPES